MSRINSCRFNASKLSNLSNVEVLASDDGELSFEVSGIDVFENKYSLLFYMASFNLNVNEELVLSDNNIKSITFEYNGEKEPIIYTFIRVNRYLSNNYLFDIYFKTQDDVVGNIEIDTVI